MKTVGELLKQARLKQQLSLDQLSKFTKIRSDYLESIENNRFSDLPSTTFVKGFIKNYARAVNLSSQHALALFRRDFDQNQQGKVIPRGLHQPIKTAPHIWSPRTTTIALTLFLIVSVAGYALVQLISFSSAPNIEIVSPNEGEQTGRLVEITGQTSPDATLLVNKKPTSIDINGNFSTRLDLTPGPHTIIIEAHSRDGKIRTLTRTVNVEDQ